MTPNFSKRLLFKLCALAALLLMTSLSGCRRFTPEPVTVTFLDPEWSHDTSTENRLASEAMLQDFSRETGILVQHLPAPENSPDQLALIRALLEKGVGTPDVFGIDVIWPGMLSRYLLDLKPYFAPQLSLEDPGAVDNYTVDGRLIAMPYHANIGVLYYRTDLLQAYGYSAPPRTWDELEAMAIRIQSGERAKGDKDFWGFVWPGAAGEGLTCIALEWQVDEGGGRIVEADKTISVNNTNAIRAWERARHWVNWISPPSVTAYQEWDGINAFKISGRAAFYRGWTSDYFLTHNSYTKFLDVSGITSVPGGRSARSAILGGFGLGVSKSTAHAAEAIKLVDFLVRRKTQLAERTARLGLPKRPELFELPTILIPYAKPRQPGEGQGGSAVARPSTVTALKYAAVSEAFADRVHSVLTGKSKGAEAAAAIEKRLVQITGFAARAH